MTKGSNEKKLLRNTQNIINKYVTIDDKLLRAIAEDEEGSNFEDVRRVLVENSEDEFLSGIADNYINVMFELSQIVRFDNSEKIEKIRKENIESINISNFFRRVFR